MDRVKKYIEENGLSKTHRDYSRKDKDKWRRYYLMKHLRVVYKLPLAEIGAAFSLDHSTVIHGLNQYEILVKYEEFNYTVNMLKILFPLTESCGHEPEHLTKCLLTLEQNLR